LILSASVTGSHMTLFRNNGGTFVDATAESGLTLPRKSEAVTFADDDNDGLLDLIVASAEKIIHFRNLGNGLFDDETVIGEIDGNVVGHALSLTDLDHDGDLDIYLANTGPNQLYRNNLDGSFLEMAGNMNLAGERVKSRDVAVGDFDEDGDMDLLVINENAGNVLYTNLRQGHFQDITSSSGLPDESGSGAVAVGDYNNDGFLDLFITGLAGSPHHLYRNRGDGSFEEDPSAGELLRALGNLAGLDATFLDFDNDGFLDLLVVGQPRDPGDRAVRIFRHEGDGAFREVSHILPNGIDHVDQVAVADIDSDGDLDLLLGILDGGVRFLRNDGGNINRYLKVRLVGVHTGGGKTNANGIGAKVEVKVGDHYQMRVVTDVVTHFGLGQQETADVMRVTWTNGVPQNQLFPRSDQTLVEEQILKGSCPFLYTWNGETYTFVTDVHWRSAIGMPLGITAGETAYGFADPTDEYFKVPGSFLKPQDGRYLLQFTEELWETAYLDLVKLVVVDHPDSIDIYVDEQFTLPPSPPLTIYTVANQLSPRAVTDQLGNDLLSLVVARDGYYIANYRPTRFQGIVETHDLIIDLGDIPANGEVMLFLNGWIFPTDASINVAMAQSSAYEAVQPYLQVPDGIGEWVTVLPNVGFPKGKNKMVIVDLTGKFLSGDHRVRLRTNLQINWDQIFFTLDQPRIDIEQTTLFPVEADIHYRGFSRLYHQTPDGPHWFDYDDVSTAPRWRDLLGNYTRYGSVTPLLMSSDNKYVVINAGDEVSLQFDATQAPPLQPGWTRDFLFYSDGWLKDGDLNTAEGKTVEPLPFHGMTSYPYGADEQYPLDEEHQAYRREYNTRNVTSDAFRVQIYDSP
ncbi:CRTAC1 family protein, partial [Candidatus Neomarinimicrobiota bacterium]